MSAQSDKPFEYVLLEVTDRVATVTIHRPDKLNALNKAVISELDRMFKSLADKGVNIHVISTSEIKISVLIVAAYTELAVRALHAAYGLDQL